MKSLRVVLLPRIPVIHRGQVCAMVPSKGLRFQALARLSLSSLRKVLSIQTFPTYQVRTEEIPPGESGSNKPLEMKSAYNLDGDYIGDPEFAASLAKRGIVPELSAPDHNVCSVGYCEAKQKWYGWSHRAMYGFGVGSKVKKGDCAFHPSDPQEFLEDVEAWYSDDMYQNKEITLHEDGDSVNIHVSYEIWPKGDESQAIYTDHVEQFNRGRGEWQAETMDDAKQMAIDFASGVS